MLGLHMYVCTPRNQCKVNAFLSFPYTAGAKSGELIAIINENENEALRRSRVCVNLWLFVFSFL
jgi:hypothetical protein